MSDHFKTRLLGAVCVAALSLATAGIASASSDEPAGINLGGTSFNDGFGGLTPGFVYQQYFQYSHFSAINDQNGNKSPAFKGTSIDAIVSLNQLIYVSPIHLGSGVLGFTGLLPLVNLNAHFAANSPVALKANGFGVGDLTFGPFLQLPPIMGAAGPVFSERVELDVVAPIGAYNRHADINQSSGFWSINPYWAFTVLPAHGFEISSRLHYLYNFTNNSPASSNPFSTTRNYQAGAAIWDNFAASYAVAPGLDVGINGYYFQQINQDKVNGVTQSNSETTNFSIGPGLTYAVNQTNFLFANAYLPVVEKNTTDGFHTVFRWVHIF